MGDGINDAPALLAATVGAAFGSQNDITTEAADAVVLETALGKIDELMHIGQRMRRIALQSALGGMVASMVGMVAAPFLATNLGSGGAGIDRFAGSAEGRARGVTDGRSARFLIAKDFRDQESGIQNQFAIPTTVSKAD